MYLQNQYEKMNVNHPVWSHEQNFLVFHTRQMRFDFVFILSMLHFLWILWTYQSPEATTYCSISDLLHNLPQLWQIKPLSCTFCWLLRHTGRLKPLSLCTQLLNQNTTIKVLRASILHFLWLLWTCQSSEATISPYPTC